MMKEFWNVIQAIFAVIGGWLGYFLGGNDGAGIKIIGAFVILCTMSVPLTLIIFAVLDYLTGFMCALADRKLSSKVGFKGICRKVLIFAMVGVGHLLDLHLLGGGSVLRTAINFFYLSNEGLSIVENSAHLGLPIPDKLRKVLEQLHDRAEKEEDKKDGDE